MNHFKRTAFVLFAILFGVVFSCQAQRKKYSYRKRTPEEKARYFTKKMVDSLNVTDSEEEDLFKMNIAVTKKFDSLRTYVDKLERKERSAAYRKIYAYRDSCMKEILPIKEFLKFQDMEREKWERKRGKVKKRVMKKNKKPIEIIESTEPVEIRMGSPYNLCSLKFIGTKLQLPETEWQDKHAWSEDNKYLILIRWDLTNNEPGFKFYIVDTEKESLRVSNRIDGLINSISIVDSTILYNKFLLDIKKSSGGNLCCNYDEKYSIE